MKRIELFEFEDFHWLPSAIRRGITNLIIVFHKMIGTTEVLTNLLNDIHKKIRFEQMVDMGSGSGGAMLETIEKLNQERTEGPIKLLLTDYHPNPKIVADINSRNLSYLKYQETSLDAKHLEEAPAGLKTMIASFHHMKPEVAGAILKSSQKNKQPIFIYELAQNNIPVFVWSLLLPISLPILMVMSLIMTPFVKPLSFSQLLFTYLIPIIPIIYAWDGQASLMRTYTFDDIKVLIGEQEDGYIWEIKDARKPNGKKAGYYILGYPQ